MRNLVVFVYFVFLFKIAFAQSLPSLPGLDGTGINEDPNLIPEFEEVPTFEAENNIPEFEVPQFDESDFAAPEFSGETPSLGGRNNNDRNSNQVLSNKVDFETENVEQKEDAVLSAIFKQEVKEVEVAQEDISTDQLAKKTDVDRFNDFEKNTNRRASHQPITYSEGQLIEHLVLAARSGNRSAVLSLLHSGRNPNSKNQFGETPLMASIYNGHNTITEILLAEGANPNDIDNKGNTALHVAAAKGNYFAVEQLVKRGATVDPRNRSNDTPLLIATLNNSLDIVDVLIRNGADVNKSNDDGLSPLHVASFNGNIEVVKYLLYVGGNANMINRDGLKPYDLAYGKNLDIARLLAGYTGREKYVSSDIPKLLQQQNMVNQQVQPVANYDQQFSLVPESYAKAEDDNNLRQRQSQWWGARQTAQQSVIPASEVLSQQPQQQVIYQQPASVEQQVAMSIPAQSAPIESAPIQQEFDYESLAKSRASSATLSNVASISNKYAPTQQPQSIIRNNVSQLQVTKKPKSDRYALVDMPRNIPTPKSMTNSRYNNIQQQQQQTRTPPLARTTYSRQQVAKTRVAPKSSKKIIAYSSLPANKKISWDRNLEKWVKASSNITAFSPKELEMWKKQRQILQSVFQDQFNNNVEKTKRRIAAQQSSSINYGVKVTPLGVPKRTGRLTRQNMGRARVSHLNQISSSAI